MSQEVKGWGSHSQSDIWLEGVAQPGAWLGDESAAWEQGIVLVMVVVGTGTGGCLSLFVYTFSCRVCCRNLGAVARRWPRGSVFMKEERVLFAAFPCLTFVTLLFPTSDNVWSEGFWILLSVSRFSLSLISTWAPCLFKILAGRTYCLSFTYNTFSDMWKLLCI